MTALLFSASACSNPSPVNTDADSAAYEEKQNTDSESIASSEKPTFATKTIATFDEPWAMTALPTEEGQSQYC